MATIDTQAAVLGAGNAASPEVFTTIAQLVNIGEVGVERSLIDTTNLASTIREYKGAIPDGTEVDFDFQYDPDNAQQTALKTRLDANTTINYRVTLSDSPATTFTFAGLVVSWKISNPIDNIVPLAVRIKVTGSLTVG